MLLEAFIIHLDHLDHLGFLAGFSDKPWRAIAAVASDEIHTGGSIFAWDGSTLVDICFAVTASISGFTITAVTSYKIHTRGSVLTWIR